MKNSKFCALVASILVCGTMLSLTSCRDDDETSNTPTKYVITSTFQEPNGSTFYKYDNQGRCIQKVVSFDDVIQTTNYTYTPTKIVSSYEQGGNASNIKITKTYQLDEKGRIFKEDRSQIIAEGDTAKGTSTYEYDAQNQVVSIRTSTDPSDNNAFKLTWKDGNLMKIDYNSVSIIGTVLTLTYDLAYGDIPFQFADNEFPIFDNVLFRDGYFGKSCKYEPAQISSVNTTKTSFTEIKLETTEKYAYSHNEKGLISSYEVEKSTTGIDKVITTSKNLVNVNWTEIELK